MSMEISEVAPFFETKPYDTDIAPALEKYVGHQMAAETEEEFVERYSSEANVALLKLYKFHPEIYKEEVVSSILLLSIMNVPKPDFNLCLYMVDEKHHSETAVVNPAKLSNALESGKFAEFFTLFTQMDSGDVFKAPTLFITRVRKYILTLLARTFVTIEPALFMKYTSFSEEEVEQLLKSSTIEKVTLDDDKEYYKLKRSDDEISESKHKESVEFRDFKNFLSYFNKA